MTVIQFQKIINKVLEVLPVPEIMILATNQLLNQMKLQIPAYENVNIVEPRNKLQATI
jgi:hypothetical protein